VLALVTGWMDVPAGGMVEYGGRPIPRERLLTWDEVRRMQASGLVEIASHSDDLHRVLPMNREGNTAPAARSWAFDPKTGTREDDARHRARVLADLRRSRARILAETGRAPRALVWPFGRFSGPARDAAREAGFTMALTLEPEVADAREPFLTHRYYPTRDPDLGTILYNLAFAPPRAETVRLACLDLAPMAALADPESRDRLLGQWVEAVRELGATAVVLPLLAEGGPPRAFLPSDAAPLAADVFGRVARQLSTRAGVEAFGRLDRAGLAALGEGPAAMLLADAARAAPIDGLVLPADGALAAAPAVRPTRAAHRAARAVSDAPHARLFRAAAAIDPRLRLVTEGAVTPDATADRALLPAAEPRLAGLGWRTPSNSGRVVEAVAAPAEMRALQRQGATALALCPWNPSRTPRFAPVFSGATVPWRP